MNSQQITVNPITDSDVPAVVDLIIAQANRLHSLDALLEASRPRNQIAAALAWQRRNRESQPLVARNARGQVRGYVLPSIWELSPENEMLAFVSARNGTFQNLTLPAPTDEDTQQVVAALFTALTDFWRAEHTDGDTARWPSRDLWFEPLLLDIGFVVDSVLAYHPPRPLASSSRPLSPLLHTRLARPEDEEMLVKLLLEELTSHLPYTPFVRIIPALEREFRARLTRLWAGESLEDGAPLVVVVERAGEIVAMAENALWILEPDDTRRFLPPGRYGYLNNVGVREQMRGQGIGRVLVRAVFDAFTPAGPDGYALWFSQGNPLARTFWTQIGFQPLWRTYQHLHRSEKRAR